jgi:hypothetical protein
VEFWCEVHSFALHLRPQSRTLKATNLRTNVATFVLFPGAHTSEALARLAADRCSTGRGLAGRVAAMMSLSCAPRPQSAHGRRRRLLNTGEEEYVRCPSLLLRYASRVGLDRTVLPAGEPDGAGSPAQTEVVQQTIEYYKMNRRGACSEALGKDGYQTGSG